jgi:tetratricopeptide (TPR) repeat protein
MTDRPTSIGQPRNGNGGKDRRALLVGLARVFLFVLVLLVFGRAATFDFTGWDDVGTIQQNRLINPPTMSGLGQLWHEPQGGLYVPVTYTAWWIAARFAVVNFGGSVTGLRPWPFHAMNVVAHALATLLVFELLLMLIERFSARPNAAAAPLAPAPSPLLWPALVGSLIFALHPVQVETVAWISGGKDVLAGLFSVGTIVLWLKAQRGGHHAARLTVAAIACGIVAMLAKPVAVMLAPALLAADLIDRRRDASRCIAHATPLALAGLIILAITWRVQNVVAVPAVAASQRPLVAADTLTFYLEKIFWPTGLAADYGRTTARAIASDTAMFKFALAGALILAIALAWRVRPMAALGASWFILFILPVSGLATFMFQIHSTVADHYLYLPMVGVAAVAAVGASAAPVWVSRVAGVVLCVLLATLSWRQLGVWHDSVSLFSRVVEVNPDSSGSQTNLGNALAGTGEIDDATDHFRLAVKLNPLDVSARTSLAQALLQIGDYAGAVEQATGGLDAIRFQPPRVAETGQRLFAIRGEAYAGLGQMGPARADLVRAGIKLPEDWPATTHP